MSHHLVFLEKTTLVNIDHINIEMALVEMNTVWHVVRRQSIVQLPSYLHHMLFHDL